MNADERADFHTRLDALLDRRERIEAHVYGRFARNISTFPEDQAGDLDSRSAYTECAAFARDVAGPVIPWRIRRRSYPHKPGRTPESEKLSDLLAWFDLLAPLLEPAGGPPEIPVNGGQGAHWRLGEWPADIALVRRELSDLIEGEAPSLFAPALRAPGQQAQPYLRASTKLMALALDRAYASENAGRPIPARIAARTWRERIADAFGVAGWDTIEKWVGPCRREMGDHVVDLILNAASDQEFLGTGTIDLDSCTRAHGAVFREVARRTKGGERERKRAQKSALLAAHQITDLTTAD